MEGLNLERRRSSCLFNVNAATLHSWRLSLHPHNDYKYADMTQKQQQQKQVDPILLYKEIRDLQEILAGIYKYLQSLGDIYPK
jgi:hypothetical protein